MSPEETYRTLRRRLAEVGHSDSAWIEQPTDDDLCRPGGFGELPRWLPEVKYLVFTGDPESTIDPDHIDTLGTWVHCHDDHRQQWHGLRGSVPRPTVWSRFVC